MSDRVCFLFGLKPGVEEEYRRRHDEIWPEMTDVMNEAGVSDYSIYCAGSRFGEETLLLGVLKASPDYQTASAICGGSDINRRWAELMEDLVAWQVDACGEMAELEELFRHGGSASPSPTDRVCFVFELKPGAEEQYRRRHDQIWPEMTDLLNAAGISDYSIFSAGSRLGEGAVLFGVLKASPDWATASAVLEASDVQRRWGEAMHDLIAWQLDARGELQVLEEIFRHDAKASS